MRFKHCGGLANNFPIDLTCMHAALDFTPTPQTVVFPVGSVAVETRCLNIPFNDDTLHEVSESFFISVASSDPSVEFLLGRNMAVVTIIDDDSKKMIIIL